MMIMIYFMHIAALLLYYLHNLLQTNAMLGSKKRSLC